MCNDINIINENINNNNVKVILMIMCNNNINV